GGIAGPDGQGRRAALAGRARPRPGRAVVGSFDLRRAGRGRGAGADPRARGPDARGRAASRLALSVLDPRDLLLRVGEAERPVADPIVEVVLGRVDLLGALLRLGPE